jgi:tRNA A37 threonylcarbamoyltransferase TsaD
MKSQVQQLLSKHFLGKLPDDHHIAEICRSFEQTIARIFEDKIIAAVQEFEPASFWFV